VQRWGYVAMLAFCLIGTLPLEVALGARVYRRWRRLGLSILPVLVMFLIWDVYAVRRGQWYFDPQQVLGPSLGSLPVEEVLFFVVVPTAAVLTLEAVRTVRGWRVGDEGDRS
jgi:lycopene cyclase domain-containing protein